MQWMQWRRPPTLPGRLPPPPGGQDPPPLDRRGNSAMAWWRQSLATVTTSMPATNVGALFIGREDREGDNDSGVATKVDDDTDTEAWGYACNFLEVVLRRLWEGRFGRRRTTTKTTETSRDDEHEEDVMAWSMFETLCEGQPSSSLSTACLKHRSSRGPWRGRAGRIRCRRNDHGRGKDNGSNGTGAVSVMTTATINYQNTTTRHAQSHNNITFNKKHIIFLIFCS